MTIDAVVSCGIVGTRYPMFLLLGAIASFTGFLATVNDEAFGFPLLLVGAVLAGMYFWTRKTELVIASAGERIAVLIAGIDENRLLAFLDAVEKTKLVHQVRLTPKATE